MANNNNIARSVAGGVAWMLLLRMSLRMLGLVSTVILARLLTPADFGLVAIAMSFFALLHLFKDFGFDTVIIQMQQPAREHYDTAWTFNIIFGVCLAILLVCFSGVIANFYNTTDLQPLIWAVASLFIIGGLGNVATLDFRKNLTFEKEFKLKFLPKLIGVPCTLILAFWLRNYWALTIGTIVTSISGLCIGYMMHSYRPKLSLSAAKELFNFSKWLMANNFIYFINNRSPELFIGKVINPEAAGLFSVANEVAMTTTTEFSAAVSRATYPGYAKVANSATDLKNLYLNVISSSALLLFPMAIGVFSITDLLVPVFLGDQWLSTIPIIKIIVIAGLLMALGSNTGYVFMAAGNPRMSTILGASRMVVFIPCLLYLLKTHGLIGAAWSILLTALFIFFVSNLIILNKLSIRVSEIATAIFRPFLGCVIMILILNKFLELATQTSIQDIWLLSLAVFLGAAVYFTAIFSLWYVSGRPLGPETKIYQMIIRAKKVTG